MTQSPHEIPGRHPPFTLHAYEAPVPLRMDPTMALPHSLTRPEWEALRRIARRDDDVAPPTDAVIGRLTHLDMVSDRGGRLSATPLGRSAIVYGSPALWSV